MYKSYKILFLLIFALFITSGAFAQTCMFVSQTFDPYAPDVILKDWLEGEGYTIVTIASDDDISSQYYTDEEIRAHDFMFISESVSSSDMAPLKGAPIPTVTLEMWGSKWDVYGWVPNNTSGKYYENTTEGTIKILDGDHPLAAGFATDAEVDIVSGTSGTSWTCYTNPQVEHIAVAELLTSTPESPKKVVVGIEAGTPLYEAQKGDDELPDGSVVSENRVAGVGISYEGNDFLTENGFKILKAAVDWVLGATAIEDEPLALPAEYKLNQNYPNPFNPITHISYTLEQGGYVNLTVYNVLGQEVATLVDGISAAGENRFSFDASGLQSGVYFYTLTAGDYTETKKMMLIK